MEPRKLTKDEKEGHQGATLITKCTSVVSNDEPKFEDFKLLKVIGEGAFGKVYLAQLKFDDS